MMHATDEDYDSFVKMEVTLELAVRNSRHAQRPVRARAGHAEDQVHTRADEQRIGDSAYDEGCLRNDQSSRRHGKD